MSGETEKDISGWTTDTLKMYVERVIADNDLRYQQRFESQESNLMSAITAQEKAVSAALGASERAVAKAEIAAEKRFDAVNEFRGQLSDQAREFMPRKESELQHSSLAIQMTDVAKRIDRIEGARGGSAHAWGYVVGVLGAVVGLASLIFLVVHG